MNETKLLIILVITVLAILIGSLIAIPYFATGGDEFTFPPKPPVPGLQRSPALDRVAP